MIMELFHLKLTQRLNSVLDIYIWNIGGIIIIKHVEGYIQINTYFKMISAIPYSIEKSTRCSEILHIGDLVNTCSLF